MDEDIRIIGKSPHIKDLLDFIKISSRSDDNILILGATGVGKELAAINIHHNSHRKDQPFIKINCANLNENLLESELFGHKKGAFTGAVTDKTGLIEAANLGTFFFDEIGDTPPFIQAKLLSVIEEKKIRRLGENKYKRIDMRFIFATNKNLDILTKRGKFREDLYYRIREMSFCIPPLKERKEDIPLLVKSILNKNKTDKIIIEPEALLKLQQYSYPGNVRELESIIKSAVAYCKNNIITEKDIRFTQKLNIRKKTRKRKVPYSINRIINVLVKNQGNKTRAASELGISRVHLYRILNSMEDKISQD
jgi:transcriptional regulator with PAS, ATPase and Fis domain